MDTGKKTTFILQKTDLLLERTTPQKNRGFLTGERCAVTFVTAWDTQMSDEL